MKIHLVWNKQKTECVGFTNRQDAHEAAGLRKVSGSASTLAEHFREMYADEDIFEDPVEVFEVQVIEV